MEAGAQGVWQDLLRPIATEMRDCAPELAERTVARMRSEIPQLFPDAQSVEENLVSTAAGIRQLAEIFERAADPREVELPAPTLAVARAGAQRVITCETRKPSTSTRSTSLNEACSTMKLRR